MWEYLVLVVTFAVAANHYFDNRLFPMIYNKYRKYFHIFLILLVGIFIFYSLQMQTNKWRDMINHTNKYLPDDMRQAIHPVLDFTQKSFADEVVAASAQRHSPIPTGRVGGPKVMRSVSEKTKKLVAAGQNWTCAICGQVLPPTYEVDHIMRLEFGGSNDVSNLQALCPNCHRYKTMVEKP